MNGRENKHNRGYADQNGNSVSTIESLLPTGKENAISARDLVTLSGCASVRHLQERIAIERKAGAVICSSTTGGYFLPADQHEIAEFCHTLEGRARNTIIAIQSAKRALRGQQDTKENVDKC